MPVALLVLALSAGCSRQTTLLSELSGNEAMLIQHALAQAGVSVVSIPGKDGRLSVTVLKDQEAHARRILLEQGLPRPEYRSFGDIFGKEGMLTSPFEERARYLFASSQGLEDTLRNIDGVIFAKVHLVMPESKSLVRDSVPSSASVFLKYRAPSPVETMRGSIQRLVANGIPGLTPDRVVVVVSAVEAPIPPPLSLALEGLWSDGSRTPVSTARSLSSVMSHVLTLLGGAGIGIIGWGALQRVRRGRAGVDNRAGDEGARVRTSDTADTLRLGGSRFGRAVFERCKQWLPARFTARRDDTAALPPASRRGGGNES